MLYLVRHGQSQANAEGRLAGRSDFPLTDLGRRQAAQTGETIASSVRRDRPVVLVSSPLTRTRETAGAVFAALQSTGVEVVSGQVEIDERLIELDYGELDGVVLREVDRERWSAWRADVTWRPPAGETLVELQSRVDEWCEELAAGVGGEGDVVAVSHVSPIKASAIWALRGDPSMSWRMSLGVAAITRLQLAPPSVVSFGETGHLSG